MSKDFLLKWVEPKLTLPKERQRFGNRELFALILPILVEQLLTMLVGIADTRMVSYAGEAALFRSMGKKKTIMNISIVMNAINVIGNAIGIFVLDIVF